MLFVRVFYELCFTQRELLGNVAMLNEQDKGNESWTTIRGVFSNRDFGHDSWNSSLRENQHKKKLDVTCGGTFLCVLLIVKGSWKMNKTNTTIRGIFANRAFFTRIVRIDLVQKIRKLLCLDSRQQQKKAICCWKRYTAPICKCHDWSWCRVPWRWKLIAAYKQFQIWISKVFDVILMLRKII